MRLKTLLDFGILKGYILNLILGGIFLFDVDWFCRPIIPVCLVVYSG